MNRSTKCAAVLCAASVTIAMTNPAHGAVNVVELTATQIEAGLAAHQYTDQQLVQAYLDRITQYNPTYNAFTYLDPTVLSEAATLDAQLASNGGVIPANEPLFGVPIVVKDSMNVAGVRTTGGYSGFTAENGGADMIPTADAPIVARLRAAGALILGKTNLPQFARTGASANTSYLGRTLNAENIYIIPGGSSTGTATATSASFATEGTAEETGGSIENPAGAQELVGVKTTFGLVPTSGGIPLNGSTRDVFGMNAKTVTDAANFLTTIAGYDPSDPKTAASNGKIPTAGYAAGLSTGALAGKRIGLFSSAFKSVTLSAETQTLYAKDIAILTSLGATVVTDVFSDPALAKPFNTLASAPITSSAGTFTFSAYSGVNEPNDLQQWLATMNPAKSPTSVAAFQAKTGINLLAASGPLLGSYASTPGLATSVTQPDVSQDGLVAAFNTGKATMLGEYQQVLSDYNLNALFFPQMYQELPAMPAGTATGSYPNTTVSEVNLMGTPLVDLPGGNYSDGTPFSVAFLGDQFSEASLLGDAYAFEQATHFRQTPVLVPEPSTVLLAAVATLATLGRRRGRQA